MKHTSTWAAWRGRLAGQIPLISLIALCILTALLTPRFLSPLNLTNILVQSSIMAVIAMGMTFVIIGGGFDLSVGSTAALAGCVAGMVMLQAGIAAASSPGSWQAARSASSMALLSPILNVNPFITTLGTMVLVRGVVFLITGGAPVSGEFGLPGAFVAFGSERFLGIHLLVWVPAMLLAILSLVMYATPYGRRVYATGGGREAAYLSGIPVRRVIASTYVWCGALAGVAGVMLAARLQSGQPTAGEFYELTAIAAVVLGGASLHGGEGSLYKSVIGVFIMIVLGKALNLLNVDSYWQRVAVGVVIIAAAAAERLRSRAVREDHVNLRIACDLPRCCLPRRFAPAAAARPGPDKITIGVSLAQDDNPFYIAMLKGIRARAQELGWDVVTVSANEDKLKQINGVQDLVARGVKGILISPIDAVGVNAAYDAAAAGKVPIVSVARGSTSPNQTIHVAMDEKQIGRDIAEWTAKRIGGKGKVAMLLGPSGAPTFSNLADGYMEVMAKYPDIKIVFQADGPLTRERGVKQAEDALVANPDLAAIYTANDDVALGATQAVLAANRKGKTIVTGMNGVPPALRAVKDDNMAMTVELNPVEWGRLGVDVLATYLKGDKVDPRVFIKHQLIDSANVDSKLPKS